MAIIGTRAATANIRRPRRFMYRIDSPVCRPLKGALFSLCIQPTLRAWLRSPQGGIGYFTPSALDSVIVRASAQPSSPAVPISAIFGNFGNCGNRVIREISDEPANRVPSLRSGKKSRRADFLNQKACAGIAGYGVGDKVLRGFQRVESGHH